MGKIFALLAAICNSSIGIFATLLLANDIEHSNIAFFRCITALLLTTAILFIRGNIKELALKKREIFSIGVAAFWGIFVLYTFEIWSIKHASISLVSFFIYSSGIFTLILAAIFLNEKITQSKVVSSALIIAGLVTMGAGEHTLSLSTFGATLALIAGLGYALFLFFIKKNAIPSGLPTLWWMFLFGTIYLAFPFGWQNPSLPTASNLPAIFFLALIPTLGGFYFTCKALEMIEAGHVQLIEMSEPLFATTFAFLIFNELLSSIHYTGIFLILCGLLYLECPQSLFRGKLLSRNKA